MLTIYVPSRGRPDAARALRESFHSTVVTNDVELVFLIDDDDLTVEKYPRYGSGWNGIIIGQSTGDPTGPLNAAVKESKSDIVGFMGDDSRFETMGWDRKILDAMKQPVICWGDDGHDRPWPSTVFIDRKITDALGYMVPPTLRRGYFDVVWCDLARLSGTGRILGDLMFRHDNSAGDPKSPNFKASHMVPPEMIESDRLAYERWAKEDLKTDAQKIRHAIYA